MHHGRHVTVDAFFEGARAMRRELDVRLADRAPPFDARRFVWEPWHVDGQFSQLRTPARSFFPPPLIAAFEARLLRWAGAAYGVSRLGGPPWLSVITDGGFQSLHRDGPNGQIAFTFALGRSRRFRGGETLIAKDELLDYFGTGSHRSGEAHMPLFDEIAPRPNRLVAFDSRIPHAVRAVEGPRHARDGRIAVQGWLEASGCIVDGGLDATRVKRAANAALGKLTPRALAGAEGLVAVRIAVGADGRARGAELRASTLARTRDASRQPERATVAVLAALGKACLAEGPGRVTAPVLLDGRGRARVP
jgi:2OG-Fe(II) oxygenase superfamily